VLAGEGVWCGHGNRSSIGGWHVQKQGRIRRQTHTDRRLKPRGASDGAQWQTAGMATGVAQAWPAGVPGGYEFIRRLGDGANGSVLLARHMSLDRLVAIKVLHAGSYDPEGQRRLEREGRAVVSLRHPNIVTVHELLATTAGYALVMEYLPGGDLRVLMDSG